MGVLVPQVVTEDRASGAQVIDGSLKFNRDNDSELTRTPGSAGNQRTWTFSVWFKKLANGIDQNIFNPRIGGDGSNESQITFHTDDTLHLYDSGGAAGYFNYRTNRVFRDTSSWYHLVVSVDTTISSPAADRFQIYINGVRETSFQTETAPNEDALTGWNSTQEHVIGDYAFGSSKYFNGQMSQFYMIDGQQLDPSYFGFTDPLTNTWRLKKYEGTFGTNGFWLPFDGSAPIGEDKSGNGNDFIPVNFGGFVSLDKATGGKPILRTVSGGNWGAAPLTERKTYAVTVANDGGNKYFLDGVNYTSTTIPLLRGGTYKFDQSDSTNSGHPLRFATAADAAGSTEYTDGVTQSGTPGSASAYTIITVPHDAPNTLYYYCTNHNGMGGATSNSTDETKTDLYASSLVLALPMAGDITDVTHNINSTRTQLSFTDAGSTSTNDSNFYGASRDFDGSNDFLKASVPNSDALHLQASSWTIECWFNADALPGGNDVYLGGVRVDTSSNANVCWNLRIFNNVIQALWVTSNTQYRTDSPVTITASKWTHVAYVRDGNEQRLYQDGVLVATTSHTSTPNLNNSSFLEIGGRTGSGFFNGQIQDFRIYSGVAKYTEDFLVGSTKPDVLPDTPSGISYGSEFEKITDGAVAFDGGIDRLSIADSADFDQPADFTLEYYVYFANHSGNQVPVGRGTGWITLQSVAGDLSIVRYAQSALASGYALGSDRWYHFALVRSGTTLTAFVDGVSVLSATDSTAVNISNALAIGSNDASGSDPLEGFVSNVRFIKGTALYTTDFTPPREPLTNVTNTKLLCCQSTESVTGAEVTPAAITTNGNPTATNFNPFNTDINIVRGQESGYATLNPLAVVGSVTYSDGNLKVTGSAAYRSTPSTIGMSEGKWYVEYFFDTWVNDSHVGVMNDISPATTGTWAGSTPNGFAWAGSDGDLWTGGSTYNSSFDVSFGTGDTCQIAFDADNGRMYFGKNGVWLKGANPSAGTGANWTGLTNGPYHPFVTTTNGTICSANFGQKPFKYNPPEGFKTFCLANLPRPTEAAVRPDRHFNTVLYNGTAVVGRSVTGVGFKPDLIWIKNRANGVANSWHSLTDSVRGERLFPNEDSAEDPSKDVLSFLDDGMTLNYGTYVNFNGGTYAAWCWKAGDNDEIITYTTKVVSDSGNKYRFDDFGTSAVTLELAEGQTYIFDQSDSSNSGHPIRFSTTSDGTHGGGSEYTAGVVTEGTPGSAGAKTTITVASGAPTLHYYCSVHSGMGGQANTNTTKGYSNFDGTIQSRISANTDAGFSIALVPGESTTTSTYGHGLGKAPEFIIRKVTNTTGGWYVWHKDLPSSDGFLRLDTTDSHSTTSIINGTQPTDTLVTMTPGNAQNDDGNTIITYNFTSIEGFSKFGTIQGNNSADGPYINCGFKPAWIMFKNTDAVAYWAIFDSARDTFNQCNKVIRANDVSDENTNLYFIDILSNGFKIRDSGGLNGTANTIYAAFAENPTMNLYGAQATAR